MKLDGKKITRVRAFTLTVRNECKDTVFDIDFYRKKIILQKPRENEHERGGRCGTLGK